MTTILHKFFKPRYAQICSIYFAKTPKLASPELAAIDDAFGNATLYIREDHSSWKPIVHMYDVEAYDMNMRIQNGTMVDLPPLPASEDGVQFEKEVPVAPDFADFL